MGIRIGSVLVTVMERYFNTSDVTAPESGRLLWFHITQVDNGRRPGSLGERP